MSRGFMFDFVQDTLFPERQTLSGPRLNGGFNMRSSSLCSTLDKDSRHLHGNESDIVIL